MQNIACLIVGIVLLSVVLWETFETIVLPRRVTRQFQAHAPFLSDDVAAMAVHRQAYSEEKNARGDVQLLRTALLISADGLLGLAWSLDLP